MPPAQLTSDVLADPAALTRALVDIESVSGNEKEITDAVAAALEGVPHLRVERAGNVLCARTELGRASRVVLAGHLDSVPLVDSVPSTVDGGARYCRRTSSRKSSPSQAWHAPMCVP